MKTIKRKIRSNKSRKMSTRSNIPTNSYVVFRNIIRDPTKQSLSGSFLNILYNHILYKIPPRKFLVPSQTNSIQSYLSIRFFPRKLSTYQKCLGRYFICKHFL